MNVLVAGLGGASLGTEVLKCLALAGGYRVFGCDISPFAYGHFQKSVEATFVVQNDLYVEHVLDICRSRKIAAIIPGGEGPLALLANADDRLREAGVRLAANAPSVVTACSDKAIFAQTMRSLGLPHPVSIVAPDVDTLGTMDEGDIPFPAVVKPSTGTGGSRFVFLAEDAAEVKLYARYLLAAGRIPVIQEYLPVDEGEFTVGVLHLPDGRLVGSVALKRLFHAKLSIACETDAGLISSGYSQGQIDRFPEICAQAERIATALGSRGPLNVQGRVRNGEFVPFEINPRFSASTFLRAMAGFNEIDLYLRATLTGEEPVRPEVRPGYYLRSLSEVYVSPEDLAA